MGLTGRGLRIRILKETPAEKPVEVPASVAAEEEKAPVLVKA